MKLLKRKYKFYKLELLERKFKYIFCCCYPSNFMTDPCLKRPTAFLYIFRRLRQFGPHEIRGTACKGVEHSSLIRYRQLFANEYKLVLQVFGFSNRITVRTPQPQTFLKIPLILSSNTAEQRRPSKLVGYEQHKTNGY